MKAKNLNNFLYNKKLLTYSRKLRRKPTRAEKHLWKSLLQNKNLRGYRFRRQRPVLYYITDFMCTELMLVIEVDGASHENEFVKWKDRIRQNKLEKAGFTVLRFTDDEVFTELDMVGDTLNGYIDSYEKAHSTS